MTPPAGDAARGRGPAAPDRVRASSGALSDRTLGRLAWAVWWLMVAVIVSGVPLLLVDRQSSPDAWGGSGVVGDLMFAGVILTFPLVGLLILRRQPRNTIGWLLQAIGLVWALNGLAENYAVFGMVAEPGSLPGPEFVAAFSEAGWIPAIGVMGTFLFLLFPDGHLPSRRWRPVAWVCGVTMVLGTVAIMLDPGTMEESPVPNTQNPLGWAAGAPLLNVVLFVVLPLLPLGIVACAASLVVRFRRSVGVERLQLKWLALAGAVVAILFVITLLMAAVSELVAFSDSVDAVARALQLMSLVSFVLVPLSIGIAILRHGLYEVDVVINRALVYGALSATLAGVYLGSVLLLQLILSPVTSQSDLAVVGSTLAVAALFRPARRRIQRLVDRRFYRSRYDAGRTLDEFTDRLRHQVDLDAVGADLRDVVDTSVRPAHVSLWIRP